MSTVEPPTPLSSPPATGDYITAPDSVHLKPGTAWEDVTPALATAPVTPGQAACIAWNEAFGYEHGITARDEWAASAPGGRAAWEAAAQAAITAGTGKILAAAATYKRERDEARQALTQATTMGITLYGHLTAIRDHLDTLAGKLMTSAHATKPSKKSETEFDIAGDIHDIASIARAALGDGSQ